jgi:hypothetical protein
MRWYHISDGQFLFNRSTKGLMLVVRILLLAVIFSPLLFFGYWIDTLFLPLKAPGHVWLIAILLSASVLYGALFLLKGLIIGLRNQRSGWWVPLFLICVAVSCVLPAVIAYPFFNYLTRHTPALSWTLDIAFAYFVYGQYNFLNQRLPFFPSS